MSDYDTSSFDTNYGYNGQFWTSDGSAQSTEATDHSFDYNNAVYSQEPQSGHVVGDNALFQNLGHGAPDASGAVAANPNTAFGNHHNTAVGSSLSDTQAFTKSYYDSYWTEYTRWQAYGSHPYPAAQASTAQGSRQLEYSTGVAYAFQHAPAHLLPSEPDVMISKQSYYPRTQSPHVQWQPQGPPPHSATHLSKTLGPGDKQRSRPDERRYQASSTASSLGNAATRPIAQNQSDASPNQCESLAGSRKSRSSSVQSGKRPLPPMTASTNEPKGPKYPCPKCTETFTRPEGVVRHDGTKHSTGPYWVCNLCDSWQNEVREDKMRAHCDDKHRDDIEIDLSTYEHIYPYRLVDTIGERDRIGRNSTPGKRTRRRR